MSPPNDLKNNFLKFLVLLMMAMNSVHGQPAQAGDPVTLSLEEAILLAARENPNVQVQQLAEVQQKFSLYVQEWMFHPHYAINGSYNITNITPSSLNQPVTKSTLLSPTVSLLTPVGTQFTLTETNSFTGSQYRPGISAQIMQPLIRGFGRPVVEAALYNAIDSERIARLNVEGTLRTTVTSVITAYLTAVSAEYTVKIDEDSLRRARNAVKQTVLLIKAGHKAGNELVTVQADVASAQTTLVNDQNTLQQTRYALLTAIGVDPNMPVKFTSLNVSSLIRKYHVPTLVEAQTLTLENDIQYQIDQITFYGIMQRNLLVAVDNTRWQLNLMLNAQTGSGTTTAYNGANQSGNVMLNLLIPINDQVAKQAVVNAKISIQQAIQQLKQEKWSKETNAINGWNNIMSAKRAVEYAEQAERLQEKTYHVSNQKYIYGMIDSLELQTAQIQLNTARQALVRAKIGYLTALASMDLLIGNTLHTWGINVRYKQLSEGLS